MTSLIFAAGVIATWHTKAECAEPARRPNILFILADDLGYGDLGCYGCPDIKTPHLDRLAKEGVRLTDFYANGPVCTPTRCALMTGRYQQRIGGLEWAIYPGVKRLGLPPKEVTIARMLKDAGYRTAMSGKWHLGYTEDRAPNHHGFERFFGLLSGNHNYFTHKEPNGEPDLYLDTKPVEMKGYTTGLITQHALKFLDEIKAKPFFLYVAYNAPHFPVQGPDDANVEITGANWAKGKRETYVKMVESLDEGVGKLLAALKKLGLEEDTLVVFTSDNGGWSLARNAPLRSEKGQLWEGGIRVPCLARWPGKLPAGKVSPQIGIMMDWSATIVNLAGAKPPRDRPLEGIDLLPFLAGKEQPRKRTLFWRRVDQTATKTHRAVRDGDWKYIDAPKGARYLYDLSKDIGEKENLADRMPELADTLKKHIDQWEKEISPPLYDQSGDMRIK
jgi:N-acetylgalactosamine-6-sulfatase